MRLAGKFSGECQPGRGLVVCHGLKYMGKCGFPGCRCLGSAAARFQMNGCRNATNII